MIKRKTGLWPVIGIISILFVALFLPLLLQKEKTAQFALIIPGPYPHSIVQITDSIDTLLRLCEDNLNTMKLTENDTVEKECVQAVRYKGGSLISIYKDGTSRIQIDGKTGEGFMSEELLKWLSDYPRTNHTWKEVEESYLSPSLSKDLGIEMVTEKTSYPPDVKKICTIMNNNSDQTVVMLPDMWLEQKIDGKWYRSESLPNTLEIHRAEPHQSITLPLHFPPDAKKSLLQGADYRFAVQIRIIHPEDTAEEEFPFVVTAEFHCK